MEKAYRVNIDFELQVSQKTTQILKPNWQREWEYLFWWIEPSDKLLVTDAKSYQKDDLDYLSQKIGRDSFFSDNHQYSNWWGDPLSSEIVQKTDLPQLRERLYQDSTSFLGEPHSFPAVVKTNGSFGGKGVCFLDGLDDYHKIKKQLEGRDFIVEPYRKIQLDFSYYCFDDQTIYYRSDVNDGQYQGSLFSKDESWLPQADYVKKQSLILQEHLKYKNYGVDCYFYHQDDEVVLEPLCEVNSRRTIASCAYQIYQKFYSDYDYARSLLIPMKKVRNFNEFPDQSVVRLSPLHGQYFYHSLILANEEKELLDITNKLQQFLNRS